MSTSTKFKTSSNTIATTKSTPKADSPPAQFLHEAGFARVAAAKSAWCASDIVAEALRIRGHCAHVENALPAIHHYGVELGQLKSWLIDLEEKSRSIKVTTSKLGNRRQRSDTPILIAAVFSIRKHPRERNHPDCIAWRQLTIQWARTHYGDDRIACILEHVDEEYQHLHVLVHNHGASVKAHMAGHAAKLQAVRAGVDKSELGRAYRSGCVALQDAYWTGVGAASGLARRSERPRKRRPRPEHLNALRLELEEQIGLANVARQNAEAAEVEWNRRLAEIDKLRSTVASDAILDRERRLALRERVLSQAEDFVRAHHAKRESEHEMRLKEIDAVLESLSPEDREPARQEIASRLRGPR